MDYELNHQPAYTIASVGLDTSDELTTEAGALVAHNDDVEMETGIGDSDDGILKSVKDSVLGDESLFRNRYTSPRGNGVVQISPVLPGDMEVLEFSNDAMYLQSGAYVGASEGVTLDSDVGDLDTLFGGEGLFLLKVSGSGLLFLGGFGGIHERTLDPGEGYTIDSGHVVAWDESVSYDTRRVGGWKETVLSGEGLVMEFTGPGTVLLQSRNYEAFIDDIVSRVPTDSGTSGGDGGGGIDVDF